MTLLLVQATNFKAINMAIFINQETFHDCADKQWTVTFRAAYSAYHFPKTDLSPTGELNYFPVAINTLMGSRSSSMLLSLSHSSSIWQKSESFSSKLVLSSITDQLPATWAGAFLYEGQWWPALVDELEPGDRCCLYALRILASFYYSNCNENFNEDANVCKSINKMLSATLIIN